MLELAWVPGVACWLPEARCLVPAPPLGGQGQPHRHRSEAVPGVGGDVGGSSKAVRRRASEAAGNMSGPASAHWYPVRFLLGS